MTAGTYLPGDLVAELIRANVSIDPERERNGGTDPQSLAEFLAYDIPFDVEPAIGFTFPHEATHRG